MKKAASVWLILIVIISQTGCGISASGNVVTPERGTTTMTMAWWGNPTRNERTQAALAYYSEIHEDITVEGDFSDWVDYWTKLATAAVGGKMPDLIQMDYKYLAQYVQNGLLADLTPYMEGGVLKLDGVNPDILNAGSIDGNLYAVCLGVNAPALMYNKTLLDGIGITVPDAMTMEEFYSISEKVYQETGVKTNIAYNNGEQYLEYVMRGLGRNLFHPDGDAVFGVASPEMFSPFFCMYEKGMEEGWHVDPSVFANRTPGTISQDPLVYGASPNLRSWCFFAYSNMLWDVQTAAEEESIEIGITAWPSDHVRRSNYLKPSMFLAVSANAQDIPAAVKVIEYFTNDLACNRILLAERGVPISEKVAEGIEPLLGPTVRRSQAYVRKSAEMSSPINGPAPMNASEILDLLDQCEEQLCTGMITADQAAEKLFYEGNEILKKDME